MRKILKKELVLAALLVALFFGELTGCRKAERINRSTETETNDRQNGPIKGFFLLNEGNMGSNKSTLDYYDYETGVYTKNIFAERNPGVVKELGDVGNDIQIYGNKLYAVINCSHFVEVMDVNTAKHIKAVSIPNCRYIVFKGKYAYVSSYAGPVKIDPNARLGYVARMDTSELKVIDTCVVGYQPDEMVIWGDKLYVANSGGYRVPNYDSTVSVIDLNTFKVIKNIDVAINLHRLELDSDGYIWVSSRGDYYGVPSKTFVIDPRTDKVIERFNLPNSNMTRCGDSIYIYSCEWSYLTSSNTITYAIVNTKTRRIVTRNFIKDGTEKSIKVPYGVAVNPDSHDFIVTDATDYVTPGYVHCFDRYGKKKWTVVAGDIPAHIVFTHKKLQPLN